MAEKLQQEIQWLLDEKYGGEKTPAFFDDVQRLNNGEPVDYVIGFKEFLGCRIDLSQYPFIPRTETEFWVKKAIEDIRNYSFIRTNKRIVSHGAARTKEIHCLDLFAGSRCIGVAVLKHIPGTRVDFSEKDEKLFEQIKINLERNEISSNRYRVFRSDIFSEIRDQYDYIFANPPYLAEYRKDAVQKSVVTWEPNEALFGGEDGLFFIKKVLDEAPRFLETDGKLYMEFDSHEKEAIEHLLLDSNFKKSSFFRDQYGQWRYVIFS
jgi:release factor glutamine methyltransferase